MRKKLFLAIGVAGIVGVAYLKRDTLRQYGMLGKAMVVDPLVVRYGPDSLRDLLARHWDNEDEMDPQALAGALSRYGDPFDIEAELDRYRGFEATEDSPSDLPPTRYPGRVPMHRWRARARIDEFRQNFYMGGAGRLPTDDEVAAFMGMTPDKLREILRDTDQPAGPSYDEGPNLPD